MEKRYSQYLYHIGFSRSEDSMTSGGFAQEVLQQAKASSLDPCPDRKYKSYIHMKNSHDRTYVINLGVTEISVDVHQTANAMRQFQSSYSSTSSTSNLDQQIS